MQFRSIPLILLVASWAIATRVEADEPGTWASFEACSENGRYCATVAPVDAGNKPPWDRSYRIAMIEVSDQGRRQSWTASYDYDGYPGGLVAPDGKTFVYVSFWYYADSPVVSIYREGRQKVLMGGAFGIPSSSLVDTVSHKLWLSDERASHELVDEETLRIQTIDGRTHLINLEDGSMER